MAAEIITACLAAGAAVASAIWAARASTRATKISAAADLNAAKLEAAFNEERLRREFQLEYASERVAHKLLSDERWPLRTFDTLSRHLAGFEDDALRQLLVRAGAIKFDGADGYEYWGLFERNQERLGVRYVPGPAPANSYDEFIYEETACAGSILAGQD